MVVWKLADTDGGEAIELEEANGGVYHGITMEELRAKWHETVCELAKREIAVTNPENALKGALSIRYVQQSSEADTTVFASPTPLLICSSHAERGKLLSRKLVRSCFRAPALSTFHVG